MAGDDDSSQWRSHSYSHVQEDARRPSAQVCGRGHALLNGNPSEVRNSSAHGRTSTPLRRCSEAWVSDRGLTRSRPGSVQTYVVLFLSHPVAGEESPLSGRNREQRPQEVSQGRQVHG